MQMPALTEKRSNANKEARRYRQGPAKAGVVDIGLQAWRLEPKWLRTYYYYYSYSYYYF